MNYFGYVTSRKFGPMMMPVPAQNSCLREYVAQKNGYYILPSLESNYQNCYHQLFGTLKAIKEESIIVMYSVLMMPDDFEKRQKIQSIAKARNVGFAFVMENLQTHDLNKIEFELSNYKLKSFSQSTKIFMKNMEQLDESY